jgi:predicted TPR repeat methyltransferase
MANEPSEAEALELTLSEALIVAVRAHQAGDLDTAETLYGRILDLAPAQPDALHFLGLLNSQRGHHERAVELIRHSIAIEPGLPASHNNLGNVLTAQGMLEASIEAYGAALRLAPDWADAHANRGIVLRRLGLSEEAEAAFRRAVAIDARHIAAHRELGRLLVDRGAIAEGIEFMCQAIALDPHEGANWRKLAVAYTTIGRLEAAADVYRQWLLVEADNPIAAHLLAACTGEGVGDRATDAFVERTFDAFAPSFDAKLELLGYRAPALVADALQRVLGQAKAGSALDAGCGTGLCGLRIRPLVDRLVGVDLSARMLDQAAARALYDELERAELTAYLRNHPRAFAAIVCADTLVYFGSLDEVLGAAGAALEPGGCLILSLEDAGGDGEPAGHLLRPHGRYAHERSYVGGVLAAAGFERVEIASEILRREAGKPVAGLLVTARQRLALP